MTKKDNAIAVKDENAAMLADLGSLASEFAGSIQVRSNLIKIAQVKLTQAGSDQSKAGLAKVGEFYSNEKSQNFGQSITIIPLTSNESASLLEKGTKKVLCYSRDLITNKDGISCKKCPYNKYWGTWFDDKEKNKDKCKNGINVIAMLADDLGSRPVMITFRKTSFKAGKELVNKMINDKVPFASKYVLKSKADVSDGNDYVIINPLFEKIPLTKEELVQVIPVARQVLEAQKDDLLHTEVDVDDSEVSSDDFSDGKGPF